MPVTFPRHNSNTVVIVPPKGGLRISSSNSSSSMGRRSVSSSIAMKADTFNSASSAEASTASISVVSDTTSSQQQQQQQDDVLSTHIEVCVRLRPMEINQEKSQSYFEKMNLPSPKRAQYQHPRQQKQQQRQQQLQEQQKQQFNRVNQTRKPPIPTQRGSGLQGPSTPSHRGSGLQTPSTASQRGTGLQGPTSRRGTGVGSPTSKSTMQDNAPPMRQQHHEEFYAWDVVSPCTVSQSERTDRIQGRTHTYTLDRVYGPSNSTIQLYQQSVQPLVHAAMEGYHSSVLAYGQTSTGKTFTMTGTPSSPGLIPLAIRDCFEYLQNEREYLLRLSYLEVYKEHIRDLLSDDTTVPVRLFDHKKHGLIIRGLKEQVVTSPQQVFDLLAEGESRRQIGATQMNQHSSRSHVMVRLWIESRATGNGSVNGINSCPSGLSVTSSVSDDMSSIYQSGSNLSGGTTTGTGRVVGKGTRVSSLSLVDLAGSESVKLNGTNEDRRSEGHYINKSLMTLGQVVCALSDKANNIKNNSTAHIPYRDSKLTRLLQPSLSGNAQMVLICCISPMSTHIEESHNTFKFATRAKKIPQKASIQEVADEKTLLQTYREEIEALKQQLQEAKEQHERLLQVQEHSAVSSTIPTAPTSSSAAARKNNNATGGSFDDDEEIKELMDAISTMEKLILKNKPASPQRQNLDNDLLADDDDDDDGGGGGDINDKDDEDLLLALADEPTAAIATTTNSSNNNNTENGKDSATESDRLVNGNNIVATPTKIVPDTHNHMNGNNNVAEKDLTNELHRIQGILGSVIKKRQSTKAMKQQEENEEVRTLRLQLEQQEVATSLRKADSSFLQQQLEQKDDLLQEVSQILEALEKRQGELETENAMLRKEIEELKRREDEDFLL